jgi:hypothetical protein
MALAQRGLTVLSLAVQQQPVVLEPEEVKRTANRLSLTLSTQAQMELAIYRREATVNANMVQ